MCAASGTPFRDLHVARMVCESVEFYADKLGFQLFGHCLMPDHLHVLLSPANSGSSVADWLRTFKSYTGHRYVKLGYKPPLWQRSAYDHVCRESETAETVVAYIADNPVRAGLIERWSDWPWTRVFVES
jgi:putative transposase